MIPAREECLRLLEKYDVSKYKIDHMLLVEKVSLIIGRLFIKKGEKIGLNILSSAALLHDIYKGSGEHAAMGAQVCRKENIDEKVCRLVENHVLEVMYSGGLESWEEKILFYADKICEDRIVTIDQRFERYKRLLNKDFKAEKQFTEDLEKEILNKLNLTPNQLYEILNGGSYINHAELR